MLNPWCQAEFYLSNWRESKPINGRNENLSLKIKLRKRRLLFHFRNFESGRNYLANVLRQTYRGNLLTRLSIQVAFYCIENAIDELCGLAG